MSTNKPTDYDPIARGRAMRNYTRAIMLVYETIRQTTHPEPSRAAIAATVGTQLAQIVRAMATAYSVGLPAEVQLAAIDAIIVDLLQNGAATVAPEDVLGRLIHFPTEQTPAPPRETVDARTLSFIDTVVTATPEADLVIVHGDDPDAELNAEAEAAELSYDHTQAIIDGWPEDDRTYDGPEPPEGGGS